ncbi:NUDIX domain-containing protein [Streptomyces sp. L7]
MPYRPQLAPPHADHPRPDRQRKLSWTTSRICAVTSEPARSSLPGALVALVGDAGKILLTRRTDTGEWSLPGGHMEPGETITDTARREVREEIGLVVEDLTLLGVFSGPEFYYRYPNGDEIYKVTMVYSAPCPRRHPCSRCRGGQGDVLLPSTPCPRTCSSRNAASLLASSPPRRLQPPTADTSSPVIRRGGVTFDEHVPRREEGAELCASNLSVYPGSRMSPTKTW